MPRSAATAAGDHREAIRLSGAFHVELARLSGNPLFVRMLEELLPTTSLLMALYKPAGEPMCVAHSHRVLLRQARGRQRRRRGHRDAPPPQRDRAFAGRAGRPCYTGAARRLRALPGGCMSEPYGALPGHGRFDYSPIGERTRFALARRRRAGRLHRLQHRALRLRRGPGRDAGARRRRADVLNYAWREYGNRVGAWRCLDLFDDLALPVGALVNTALYDHCPQVVAAFAERGDELDRPWPHQRRAAGRLARAARARAAAAVPRPHDAGTAAGAPAGWLSPWISESRAHARPAGARPATATR